MFNSVSAPILRPAGNEIIVEGIMGASGLGSLLVKEGFLTEQDRVTITKTCGQGSWAFAKTILAIGLLDEDELAAFFAERTKYIVAARDFLDHLDQGAIQSLDRRMISKLEILPLKRDADKITVAVLDPLDRSTLKQLEFFTGLIVEPVIAPMSQLYEGLVRLDPDFSPRDTSLSQFLQNHVGAAWIKQRIVNGDDATETGATPGSATFEFREDDVEELEDDDSGIEAVDDDFDDVSGDVSDDFDDGMNDGASLDAEDDPFAGTKSTEEADSFDSSGDSSDDLFAGGASADSNDLTADADELSAGAGDVSASGSDDDFFPADSTESADSAADLLAEADDDFGDAPLDADDLTASLASEKKNISGGKAADSGPPVVDEDDAIFDALEDDSPSLESAAESDALTDEGTDLEDLTENAADDFGAEDLSASEDLGAIEDLSAADDFSATDEINVGDELSASDEINVGDDLSASDFGSEGESLGEDFSADDFAAGADDFGADEKTEIPAKTPPQNSRQAARSKGAFDAEEETAINLRPNPRPSNDDDDIALHPPKVLRDNDERDPGLTATALLNEALLRLSLCFDKESVDALLNETLPRMSAAGCLIRTDGPVRSWAQGKEGPSKLPKGALENLTTKSKEGKWQKISLSRPQSWTTKDLSLSAYRTGNWIWAHDSGEENEIFIETVESFVNQLQGK